MAAVHKARPAPVRQVTLGWTAGSKAHAYTFARNRWVHTEEPADTGLPLHRQVAIAALCDLPARIAKGGSPLCVSMPFEGEIIRRKAVARVFGPTDAPAALGLRLILSKWNLDEASALEVVTPFNGSYSVAAGAPGSVSRNGTYLLYSSNRAPLRLRGLGALQRALNLRMALPVPASPAPAVDVDF